MNIVVLDSIYLPDDMEFPLLTSERYRWSQYRQLTGADIVDRCWRADIVVTFATPLGADMIEGMPRLRMIAVAGADTGLIDLDAARARDIAVCNTPGLDHRVRGQLAALCQAAVDNIDAFIQGGQRNRVA